MFEVVQGTLAANVADAGTFVVSYPAGTDAGTFKGGLRHQIMVGQNGPYSAPDDLALTFGTASITVTNNSETTWLAGAAFYLSLERPGVSTVKATGGGGLPNHTTVKRVAPCQVIQVNIGAPDVADVDGVSVSQAVAAPGNLTITGALATGGVATFDVPRGIVIDGTDAADTTQTLTIYGTDEYGEAVVETIASNGTTAVNGKKAFKTVTRVAASAAYAGSVFVGSSDVLGLPFFLADGDLVIKEMDDDAAVTNGTFVAGVLSEATATTGDVRGTYDPNSATDGSKVFRLWILTADPGYMGATQYAG